MPSQEVYIDFHCHPEIKTFLSADKENERADCWFNVDLTGALDVADTFLGNILDSQCSLNQLKKGKISIAIAGLYALEKPMIKGKIFKLFKKVINLLKLSEIKSLEDKLNHDLLKRISAPQSSYFEVFKEIRQHLLNAAAINPGFKLLNKISEYDPGKLNLILTIEGGHVLYDTVGKDEDAEPVVLGHLDELKQNGYFFLTLTHLARIPMCTHAYGMKIIKDSEFIPSGFGITDLGKKVITKALNKKSGNRILIDTRHMSLRARLQYYEMLESPELSGIPIIMSHAGVTGVSHDEMPVYKYKTKGNCVEVTYYRPDGIMNTKFNPWSINLYDEEIHTIIQSKGIIGINLDERIQGTKQRTPKQTREYFSKKEFLVYENTIRQNINKFKKLREKEKKSKEDKALIEPNNDIKHICNNILHIVKTGGEQAWKHMCIGSDFDGLINPVECCRDSTKFKKLHKRLIKWLPKMAKRDRKTEYYINDIEKKVYDIMYGNAYEFLKNNFN